MSDEAGTQGLSQRLTIGGSPAELTRFPVAMGAYFTRTEEIVSELIQRVTGGPWSHVGLWFGFANGRRVRFEALAGKGFRGPLEWGPLVDFSGRHVRRVVLVRTLAVDPGHVIGAWIEAEKAVAQWKDAYGEAQLLTLWAWIRLRNLLAKAGLDLRMRDDPRRVVCSEAVSRLLAPLNIDCRHDVYTTHDATTPVSVERSLRQFLAEPDVYMQAQG